MAEPVIQRNGNLSACREHPASTQAESEQLSAYFHHFADYLNNGNAKSLKSFFPDTAQHEFLRVYRNGFMRSCTDALISNYPVTVALVGEDYFSALAASYIREHPPTWASLSAYGAHFPDWLNHHIDADELFYLSAFAQLDQAWLSVYFAPDSQVVTEHQLEAALSQGSSIPDMRFGLAASARIVALKHEVTALWQTIKETGHLSQSAQIEAQANTTFVWRDARHAIHAQRLSAAEHAFLTHIKAEDTVFKAASAALAIQPDCDVLSLFSQWLASGAFVKPTQKHRHTPLNKENKNA